MTPPSSRASVACRARQPACRASAPRMLLAPQVTPGTPDALAGDELAHLRNLPGPVRVRQRKAPGSNRAMLAAEAVLAYWSRDSDKKDTRKGSVDLYRHPKKEQSPSDPQGVLPTRAAKAVHQEEAAAHQEDGGAEAHQEPEAEAPPKAPLEP
jgi:hypothetical protein